jgi:hypothetical protein
MVLDAWRVLKYTGAAFAALYGIYATLEDFHATKNGKKMLSKKGRFGITLLVVASSITFISDWRKDIDDAEKDRKALDKQQELTKQYSAIDQSLDDQRKSIVAQRGELSKEITEAQKIAATTASVLTETRRMNDPFKGFTAIAVYVYLPIDSAGARDYVNRLAASGINVKERPSVLMPNTSQYPDPNQQHEFALFEIAAAKKVEVSVSGNKGRGAWQGYCMPNFQQIGTDGGVHLTADSGTMARSGARTPRHFIFVCYSDSLQGSGDIRSNLDIQSGFVHVDLSHAFAPDFFLLQKFADDFVSLPLSAEVDLYGEGKSLSIAMKRSFFDPMHPISFIGRFGPEDVTVGSAPLPYKTK